MQSNKTKTMVECAIMLALATALSFVALWEMPMGGSVTLCSMLPIMLVALRHGPRWGFGTAFLYSLVQLAQALIKGNVFVWCETADTVIICALFDYILPFTALGLVSLFKTDSFRFFYAGMFASVTVRFLCHFVSGVVIWGQWAEGMSPYLYSLLYNGGFLLPELGLCLVAAVALLEVPRVRRLLLSETT